MIKPVKRNKRLKWIDSRYARPYKARIFLRRCKLAQIVALGSARNKAIINSMGKLGKSAAIASNALRTFSELAGKSLEPIGEKATN